MKNNDSFQEIVATPAVTFVGATDTKMSSSANIKNPAAESFAGAAKYFAGAAKYFAGAAENFAGGGEGIFQTQDFIFQQKINSSL